MDRVRWNPWRDLEDVSKRLNTFFAHRSEEDDIGLLTVSDWRPAVDIQETGDAYVVIAEIPGVKKDDVTVTVRVGVLALQGDKKFEEEHQEGRIHRTERIYGRFSRSFAIPTGVDENRISAEFKDGLLTMHLPKSPLAKPQAREVKVS